jgi:hypothetical protein
MKKLLIFLFVMLILPSSVIASDIYYCVEDGAVGFDPTKNFKKKSYNATKYKMLIDFENKSITSNDLFMDSSIVNQTCSYNAQNSTLYCLNILGKALSINKINLRFIFSSIYNRVDLIDDILISYGTCEKF